MKRIELKYNEQELKKSHYHINDISKLSNSPLLPYNDIQDDTEHDKNNDKIYLKHDN